MEHKVLNTKGKHGTWYARISDRDGRKVSGNSVLTNCWIFWWYAISFGLHKLFPVASLKGLPFEGICVKLNLVFDGILAFFTRMPVLVCWST